MPEASLNGSLGQLSLLVQLYRRPLAAFGKVIDEGHFLFAVIAALICTVLLHAPRDVEVWRTMAAGKEYYKAHKAEFDAEVAKAKQNRAAVKAANRTRGNDDDDDDTPSPAAIQPVGFAKVDVGMAIDSLAGHTLGYLPGLFAVALCFVPVTIVAITLWESLGGLMTILFRDYLTLLICILLAWTAAYLPLAAGRAILVFGNMPASSHPGYWWASQLYFLALSVCAIRMVFGTSFGHAAVAAAGGWAGAVGGLCLYSVVGGGLSWLASPFMLYYLYRYMQPDWGAWGVSLRSRQHLKEQLENATMNPRDADAHYQLGLIYQQRRQFMPAIERYQKAIGIDPAFADAHFQLGRIARETGRFDDAIQHLEAAAKADDKCSTSEVWREMGVAHLLSGRFHEARAALEKYLERRPYDPEGQCWYGRVLTRLNLPEQARQAFRDAMEAVRTMPKGRKRQVSTWGSQAGKELRALG